MQHDISERLTFDRLFRMSEPKRVTRSLTVKGPPLEIDSFQDAVYYCFNFKSNPSTTGLRHRGYVKFYKPRNAAQKPLQHLECLVDCTCPDYRYRWAWTNKQRGSGVVGPQSLNQAWNKAPRKTNPKGKSGLCKHVLAARQYIYGLLSSFPSKTPDTAEKLNKLTKYATKRWTNFADQMAAAKAQEKEIARQRALRNIVGRPPEPPAAPAAPVAPPEPEPPLAPAARTDEPVDRQEKSPSKFKKAAPPKLPLKPKRPAAPKKAAAPGQTISTEQNPSKPNAGYGSKAEYDFYRRQGLGDSLVQATTKSVMESVVTSNNGKNMSDLNKAITLVQEMEDDILSGAGAAPEMGAGAIDTAEPIEPMEPPISDGAIGADTEGDTALGLLRQMKDLLTQITAAVAPPEEGGETAELEGTVGGAEVEGTVGDDMPPEPPSDEEIPSEDAGGPEADEDDDDEEDKKKNPFESANRRPSK